MKILIELRKWNNTHAHTQTHSKPRTPSNSYYKKPTENNGIIRYNTNVRETKY